MKKFISSFLCISFLFLFGCGQGGGGDTRSSSNTANSSNINNSSNPNNSSNTSNSSGKLENIPTIREAKQININLKNSSIKGLFNGNLIFETSKEATEQTADDTIYLYNLKDLRAEQIGTVKAFNTDSGDFLIMKNNSMYYCPLLFDKKGNNALIKANLTNKKVTYEQRYELDTPLVHFSKINDIEFLMYHTVVLSPKELVNSSSNTMEIHIDKYNIDTKKETTIIKKRFDKNAQSGTLIASFCLKDNLIYAYSIKGTAGKTENVIDVYDPTGKFQKIIPIPQLESILKANRDDHVFEMKTFGNYFYFSTLNSLNIMFEYTNSGLKKIDLNNTAFPYSSIVEPGSVVNDQVHNRMIYFSESNADAASAVGIFDSKTGTFKNVKLNINGFQYINRLVIDENGNIIADLANKSIIDGVKGEHCYYYIESAKLLNAQ